MNNNVNNKRIAKNTLMLYFRMLITMGVSLYTSRVILNILGVEDFGIYNVVGGFVTMFGFLNSAMASATQRFLAFEIGREDKVKLRNTFSLSVSIHFLIAFVVLIFAETIGYWLVNTQLTIPPERMLAAKWVYQFSILTLIVNMISVPYNAMIIAHERMNVFAWVSIFEVSMKLFVVFMLQWFGFDKLSLYAILIFVVSLLVRIIYGIYCSRNFKESSFYFFWDKSLFKTLISYAGWNLFGSAAGPIMGQGVNVLLNIFFNPIVNAARGIAYQVMGAINQFATNFQMAINPQIIKSYAINDLKYMHQLVFRGAKYSFFLLFVLSFPVLLETQYILTLWLKNVPNYTLIFTRLAIVNILIDSISLPLKTAAQATGIIRLYQSVVGFLLIANLPISYLFLKLHYPPEVTFYISIFISIIALIARLIILKRLVKLSILDFMLQVMLKICLVVLGIIIIPIWLYLTIDNQVLRLIFVLLSSLITAFISIYVLGLDKSEKYYILNRVRNIKI